MREESSKELEKLLYEYSAFHEVWLHGLSLQGYNDRNQLGAYAADLHVATEQLPTDTLQDFVYRPSNGWCQMMHVPSRLIVNMYTRQFLGLNWDEVYPLQASKDNPRILLPFKPRTYAPNFRSYKSAR